MKKNPKSEILEALRVAANSEADAVKFIEQQRWSGEPACPRCGDTDVYQMKDAKTGERNKDYRWRCRGCKQMFSVRTGTTFEETRLPLRVWVYAFLKACSSKKGISALQLSREMEITHKSALFVLRRIRHGVGSQNAPKLTGTVEIDETYVGGRPRYKTPKENQTRTGRGTLKTPVLGMVQRGGDVRFRMMDRLTAERLREVIVENADLTCRMITDEFPKYKKIGRAFEGGHEVVKHSAGEYARKG